MPQIAAAITAAATAFGATAAGSFLTTTFVGKLLTSVALSALSAALAPRPRAPGIKTSQTMTGGTNPCQFILGKYATGGYAVSPAMSHGKTGKTHNAYLTYVLEVSDAPVSALSSLIIDGTPVTIGTTADPDYGLPIQGEFVDRAWVKFYTGAQVAADPMLIAKYGSYPDRPWSADMIGRGLAYAVLTFRYDRKVFDSLPSVRFVVDGLNLYDPRKDSSVGGSGAQRWATPATWAFTRNPIVMIYNIMRGITLPDGSRWGGACTADDLPLANWIAAMNVCDVEVTLSGGGTIARYTAGFEVSVDDEPAAVIEELLKACNGQMVDMGGIWKVRAGSLGLPVHFFTDEDIIATRPEEFDPFPGLAETYNGITATYPEPTSLWESREAPARYNATWEAEDGGRRLVAALSLPAVTHSRQVQHLMQAAIKDHRRMRRHNLTLTPAAAIVEPLDVVSWSSSRNGYSAKQFEVAQVVEDLRSCLPQIAIREVDPTDYDWSPADELPSTPGPGGVIRPAVQAVPGFGVSGVSLTDAGGAARRPALQLVWDGAELDDAEALEWEIRRSGTTDLVAQGSTANVEAGVLRVAGGILPGTAYQARARLVVKRARAWTSWISATTPNVRIGRGDLSDDVNGAYDAIRADHDALVAGFSGNLADAFDAVGRRPAGGWIVDPIFGEWSGSQLVTANWETQSGVAVYGSPVVGAYGAGMRVVTPAGTPDVRIVANRTTGMPGSNLTAEWVVLVVHVTYTSGDATGAAVRVEWAETGGTVWHRGNVYGAANSFGTFANLGIYPQAGVVQVREILVQRPIANAVGMRLVLVPNIGTVGAAQDMILHLVDVRAATQGEIEVGQTYSVAGATVGSTITVAGIGSAMSATQTALTAQVGAVAGDITQILGLSVSGSTALGVLLSQLQVNAGGVSATITQQGSAIANLNGNASAGYLIRAQAGGSVSLLDLVAADGSAGSVSVARLSANTIILDGTILGAHINDLTVDTIKLKDGAVSVFNVTGQAGPITNNSATWTITDTMTVSMGTSSYAQAVIGLYTFALNADPASYPAGFRLQVYFASDLVAEIDKSTLTANPGVRRYTLSLARPAVLGATFVVAARIQNAGGYGIQNTNLWAIAEKK